MRSAFCKPSSKSSQASAAGILIFADPNQLELTHPHMDSQRDIEVKRNHKHLDHFSSVMGHDISLSCTCIINWMTSVTQWSMLAKRASPEESNGSSSHLPIWKKTKTNTCHTKLRRLRSGPPEPNLEMLSKSLTLNSRSFHRAPKITVLFTVALGRFVVRWPLCILRLHCDLNENRGETSRQKHRLKIQGPDEITI